MSTRLERLSDRIGRVLPPWRRWSSRQRVHAVLLFALMLASVGHQLVFVYWYIEDAAISFTYARHLADGEGLVTYPGGERVEGYSDPLWVFLMAGFELFGISGFTSSKILGCVFGALALVPTYLLVEEAFGHGGRQGEGSSWSPEPSHYSLIAPAFLAGSAQFAIWNASGLENSLFCFLLAMGMWRTQVETRADRWPTAAAWFFALSITRPEGILYAAFGGLWALVLSLLAHRSLKHTMLWLMTFFFPFWVYQATRWSYFAWPFPNTYYAKLGDKDFLPFAWNARGWKYLRDWAHLLWHGYLVPVYFLGVIGKRRGAVLSMLGAVAVFAVLLLPGPELVKGLWPWTLFTAPPDWNETRVWLLLLLSATLFARGLGGTGWRVRLMAAGMTFIALFFSLWSGGDWMKGFRWMSLLTVPTAVLFAVGSAELAPLLGRALAPVWVPLVTGLRVLARRGRLSAEQLRKGFATAGVVGLLLCIVGPNAAHSEWFARKPETGPFSVQKRVNYMNWVERRLHLLRRPTTLDVDMGANMYWSGNEIADVAGLVDVPMGHHNYERPFIEEYIFTERNPEFAHSHGGWASRSRVQTFPQWQERYFEIPGYPTGPRGLHIGNWVRKDLFLAAPEAWPAGPRTLRFGHGIRIEGVRAELPAPRGHHLYVELGLSLEALPEGARGEDWEVRVLAFLTDGEVLHSWDLPPGYDWYRPSDLQPGEVFEGRYSLKLPKRLPPGTYDLGLLVTGPDGAAPALLEAGEQAVHAGTEGFAPVWSTAEVRFPGAVTILEVEQALAEATATVEAAHAAAGAGECEAAEASWFEAQRRTTRRDSFAAGHEASVRAALAACYAARAQATEDRDERTRWLVAARDWDHWQPDYRALAVRHGELLYQDCRLAYAEGRWEEAFTLCSDSVAADPVRSWSRYYAEHARDFRLGIDPFTVAEEERKRAEEAERRRAERAELAEQRRREREARIAEKQALSEGEPGATEAADGEGANGEDAQAIDGEAGAVVPEAAPPPPRRPQLPPAPRARRE